MRLPERVRQWRAQRVYHYPNGYRAVLTDCAYTGIPHRRFEVELSHPDRRWHSDDPGNRPGYGRVTLNYFPTRRAARAYLRAVKVR